MKSASKIVECCKNIRAGYGILVPISQKVVYETLIEIIPDNCRYIHHICEDVFIPYSPQQTEKAKHPDNYYGSEQSWILGDIERTVTAYYEEK